MLSKITVSPSPHIGQSHSTRSIMLDVIIGLTPAMAAACVFFRMRAVIVIIACVASCVLTEWVCNLLRRRASTIDDLSAVVTGLILAFSLPPMIPAWVCIIGGVFAIAIAKMVYGGLGANIFNPAMAARVFLTLSFGMMMTTWTVPATIDTRMSTISAAGADAITQATPLAWSKAAIKKETDAKEVNRQLSGSFFGEKGGCLGETCGPALLLGGFYLLIRKTITFHIPAAVLLSAAVWAAAGYFLKPASYITPMMHLVGGGMLICAFFIATDPVTAPLTGAGKWIFGIGVGSLVMLIRMVGECPEGVMYAVLIMNSVSPLINRFCKPIPAGGRPRG